MPVDAGMVDTKLVIQPSSDAGGIGEADMTAMLDKYDAVLTPEGTYEIELGPLADFVDPLLNGK